VLWAEVDPDAYADLGGGGIRLMGLHLAAGGDPSCIAELLLNFEAKALF
jgi:hypothetical protein